MDNTTRGYIKPEHQSKHGRIRRFYDENKEAVLWTGLVLLTLKNRKLASELRSKTKEMDDAKKFLDEAKVSLEALALFDQAFGPRRIHSKHT
jgi:hypothetical protein